MCLHCVFFWLLEQIAARIISYKISTYMHDQVKIMWQHAWAPFIWPIIGSCMPVSTAFSAVHATARCLASSGVLNRLAWLSKKKLAQASLLAQQSEYLD
jgi:hypothetical protein